MEGKNTYGYFRSAGIEVRNVDEECEINIEENNRLNTQMKRV
jgi:hypothetical protein